MSELAFECLGVSAERFASSPTLLIRLRISDTEGEPVHAIALRCQIRIEPFRRQYSPTEGERLTDLFGERQRWGETLKPIQFALISHVVPRFTGSCELDLPVPCTYDFEVSSTKYFHSLEEGDAPLLLLFSGTVFRRSGSGFSVEQVPWHKEAVCRLPAATWREMMDLHFPNSGWIRLRRDTLDELQRFKSERALPTWEDALAELFKHAREAG